MPRINDLKNLHDRVLERLTLVIAEQCLRDSGSLHDHLARAGANVPNLREELKTEASRRLESLRREGVRATTRRGAEQLLREPLTPLAPLQRRTRSLPAPTPAPAPQGVVPDPWPYVQLRIDWTKCVRETSLEPGADEMYLVGVIVDLGDPGSDRYKLKFHLGDFRTGDREEYDGTQVVDYVNISDAKSFPTGVKCFLSVMEKDADGIFADIIGDLLDVAKSVIYQELEEEKEEGDILPPVEIDWGELLKKMIDALFGWLKQIPAPEVLEYKGRPVFQFFSPPVKSLADTWSPDHKSDARTFELTGYGGTYKINLFYRRAKTKTGA